MTPLAEPCGRSIGSVVCDADFLLAAERDDVPEDIVSALQEEECGSLFSQGCQNVSFDDFVP